MAALSELKTEEEFEQWGILDAIRQTESRQQLQSRQQLPEAAGRFEFITKGNKREVSPSTCSLQEFALTKHVMQLVSKPNTATYLLESVNYKSASTDFRKFIGFIDAYPEPGKSELSTLVFPVFVYFYLLLLQSGPSGHLDAKAFFKKNKGVFAHVESYDAVLKTLYSFRNWMDVKEDSYYKNFLECKYIIGISQDVLWALRDFIESQAEDEGDKALLYVLHFHIHFQDDDEAEYVENVSEELVTPVPERSFEEDMEHEDAKSVSESTGAELVTSPSKNSENEDIKLDGISNSELFSNKLPTSPSKSSDSDSESTPQDDTKSEVELDALLKELNLNHPQISPVVTKCSAADICSVDFNDEENEIAFAIGNNCIYIASLGINGVQAKRPHAEHTDDDTQNKQQYEEEKLEIFSFNQSSQEKGLTVKGTKSLKTSKHVKTLKSSKGSKRTKEVSFQTSPFTNEDKASKNVGGNSQQVRGMKEIKVPGEEIVQIVKYLPGRPHLLLAACNTKVKLYNTETCSLEAEYDGNDAVIFDIDVNSTSQYFATANMDLVSSLYSFDMSSEIRNFVGHLSAVTAVKFHPNGIYIATGSEDSTVRLFDIESGLCIRRFSDCMFGIVELAFSPDGKLLASGDSLGTVKVWDIKDGSEVSKISFSKEIEILAKITTLCFHSDSSLLMACNHKGECKLWDVRNPENLQVINFKNIPLKVKFCKNGLWKMAFQENPT